MIIDAHNLFSDGQAITASAASTTIVDLVKPGDGMPPLYFVAQVNNSADFATGTSLTVELQTDDNSDFTSPKTLMSSGAVATASLTKKASLIKGKVPFGVERYLRVYYTVAGDNFTAGEVDAFLTPGVDHGTKLISV